MAILNDQPIAFFLLTQKISSIGKKKINENTDIHRYFEDNFFLLSRKFAINLQSGNAALGSL